MGWALPRLSASATSNLMRSKIFLIAAITTGVILLPGAAMAQTVAVPASAAYLVVIVAALRLFDAIIELSPLKENTVVSAIRSLLNQFFSKKPQ